MKSLFINEEIKYIGTQLSPHWIYKNYHLLGDAIVSFVGEIDVKITEMVDIEDVISNSPIYSKKMISFIIEQFGISLSECVLRQRFLICIIIEELRKILKDKFEITRSGDDIFVKINGINKKLSVSIATKSTTSGLIHTGLNIDPTGAPVQACGLTTDLGITEIEEFAQNVMKRYIEENDEILDAVCKVRGV